MIADPMNSCQSYANDACHSSSNNPNTEDNCNSNPPSMETVADCSLFVANLPQSMNNEELAVALYGLFCHFGSIQSVKASRDHRGRPFGFVDFENNQQADLAASQSNRLVMHGRRIRVEIAKNQRKICIKQKILLSNDSQSEFETEMAQQAMATAIIEFSPIQNFKLSIHNTSIHISDHQISNHLNSTGIGNSLDDHQETNSMTANNHITSTPRAILIAAIVKFEDAALAETAFHKWTTNHPDWSVTWIHTDRMQQSSNIRNSGLVQLVPSADGTFLYPPQLTPALQCSTDMNQLTLWNHSPSSSSSSSTVSGNSLSCCQCSAFRYSSAPFEDASFTTSSAVLVQDEAHWMFVGRLNSRLVTIAQLQKRFAQYGIISFIRLYNRNAIGIDGVPLDAYALISFQMRHDMLKAIELEHGRTFLGQALKCEPARMSLLQNGNTISPSNTSYEY